MPTRRSLQALDQRISELSIANKFEEALPLAHRYLEEVKAHYGTDTPEYAIALTSLAGLLRATDRRPEAEPLFAQAAATTERLAPDDSRLVGLFEKLAWRLMDDRPREAEHLLRRALATAETSFGIDHPNVAPRPIGLAVTLQDTVEAETLMRRAVAIEEGNFGPDHPNVAGHLNALALLLRKTNRLSEAEALLHRAFAIDEKGSDRASLTNSLFNLVWVLQLSNRFTEAEPLLRRALAFHERHVGPDHPDLTGLLNILSQVLRAANRLPEAEAVLHRAVAIHEKHNDPGDSVDPQVLHNLARLLRDTNRHAEADELLRS